MGSMFSILERNGEKRKVYIKYRDRLPLVPLKMVFKKILQFRIKKKELQRSK